MDYQQSKKRKYRNFWIKRVVLLEIKNLNENFITPKIYGPEKSDLTVVCWGSTKGVVLDVLNELKQIEHSPGE